MLRSVAICPPVSSVFDGEILLLRDLWIPVNLQLSGGVFKYLPKNSSCWYFKTSILYVFPSIFTVFYFIWDSQLSKDLQGQTRQESCVSAQKWSRFVHSWFHHCKTNKSYLPTS